MPSSIYCSFDLHDDDYDHDDDLENFLENDANNDYDKNVRIKPSWLRRWRALKCVVFVICDASQIQEENEKRTKLQEGKEELLSWTSFLR